MVGLYVINVIKEQRIMVSKRSIKRIKELSEILLPFKITFPVTIEGGVNQIHFFFPKGQEVELTYEQYECIRNSSFSEYLP
jgi:hypothetical protein